MRGSGEASFWTYYYIIKSVHTWILQVSLWNVYPRTVDLKDPFRAKRTQHLVNALCFCLMKIRFLRPISKYRGKGIQLLPYGSGKEDEIKTNGRKHIEIFASFNCSNIKSLQYRGPIQVVVRILSQEMGKQKMEIHFWKFWKFQKYF